MLSVGYIMRGVPKTLADCLDKALKTPVFGVWVRPQVENQFCEFGAITRLSLDCIWFFSDRAHRIKLHCGGYLIHDTRSGRDKDIARTNQNLEKIHDILQQFRVHVQGSLRFEELRHDTNQRM